MNIQIIEHNGVPEYAIIPYGECGNPGTQYELMKYRVTIRWFNLQD